ncbi:MAG: hypothetical protein HC896_10330 [Bacteroidales bacterium]|nr:hypothetical protein [Bacteroidales bacterium]
MSMAAYAQLTSSPYSTYGLGELYHPAFGASQSLGGAGVALRHPNQVNFLNPAAYTSQDTLSFVFDVGVSSRFRTYSTATQAYTKSQYNLDHIAMSFPITRFLYASLGIMPFASTGYEFKSIDSLAPGLNNEMLYKGNGGINQVYFGTGICILKNLSVGVNVRYLFGFFNTTSENFTSIGSISSFKETSYDVRDFVFNAGVQYYPILANKHILVIGANFQPPAKLNIEHQKKQHGQNQLCAFRYHQHHIYPKQFDPARENRWRHNLHI